jgi:hypothetical protein
VMTWSPTLALSRPSWPRRPSRPSRPAISRGICASVRSAAP